MTDAIRALFPLEPSALENLLLERTLESQKIILQNSENTPTHEFYEAAFQKNIVQWRALLADTIARSGRCKVFQSESTVIWFGFKEDVDATIALYEAVEKEMNRLADIKWKAILDIRKLEKESNAILFKDDFLRNVHGKAWKNAYLMKTVGLLRETLIEVEVPDEIDRYILRNFSEHLASS